MAHPYTCEPNESKGHIALGLVMIYGVMLAIALMVWRLI